LLPDLTVLIALLLGLVSMEDSPADPSRALLGSACCLLIGGALSRLALRRGLRALSEDENLLAEASMRWTTIWPFAAWMAAIYFFHWGAWVSTTVPRTWWLMPYVVLFVPGLATFCVGWASRVRLEARLIERRGGVPVVRTSAEGIRRGLRRNGIVFLPVFALLALQDGIWIAGTLGVEPLRVFSLWQESSDLLNIAIMFGLVFLALPIIPGLIARALHAKPLPAGPVRTLLERAAADIGLRYGEIMLWPTGGRIVNAMVVGFTPRTRRIILTDGLIGALPADELLAVFFHEAGHAKRHHLTLFLLLFLAFSLLVFAATAPLMALGIPPWMLIMLQLAVIWFVILGWVSRRFERESDIFGAEHAAILDPHAPPVPMPGLPLPLPRGAALMVRALERVRAISGHAGGHRHGTIEERIAFVAHHAIDPDLRQAHKRACRGLKVGIALALVAGVVASAWSLPTEIARGEAHVMEADALRDYEAAWMLEHARTQPEVARAPARWRQAYEHLLAAARRLEGHDDVLSRSRRARDLFNAADTALHGLRDHVAARKLFTTALEQLEDLDVKGPGGVLMQFQAHIDLGRLEAWAAVEHPTERGPDFKATLEHLASARALLRERIEGAEGVATPDDLLDERLRLLRGTYDGARGETEVAREALRKLAQLAGSDARQRSPRLEIAEDARAELERLRGQ